MTERLEVMMDKVKFNRYCAEVMGYTFCASIVSESMNVWLTGGKFDDYIDVDKYNPYDDLNQMAEVFDKLWCIEFDAFVHKAEFPNIYRMINESGIKQAMRDFIISTMQEDKE